MCFEWEMKKITFQYALLSGGLIWLPDVCQMTEIRSMFEYVSLDLKSLGLYI